MLEYLERILLKHELYFSSPVQLKDPLDTRPRFTITSRDVALQRLMNPFLATHARDMSLEELTFHVRQMSLQVRAASLDRLAADIAKVFHAEMEKHRLYSMTRPDNQHLWNEYAADHTGWCLEFANQSLFMFAHHVIYDEERTIDFGSPSDQQEWKYLYRKTLRYVPEEEVRIFKFPRGQAHQTPFEPSLLRRIILGKNMTEEHRQLVQNWCKVRVPELLAMDENTTGVCG